ncbi:MAG: thiamine diphosphokinase [Candidatus Limnocylindrales bacterium]
MSSSWAIPDLRRQGFLAPAGSPHVQRAVPGLAPARVIVVADGDVDSVAAARATAPRSEERERPLVIAADGGATKAESIGLIPDLIIGDGDSLADSDRDRLAALGVLVRTVPAEKDESDAELCVLEALARGATEITFLGALGGPRPEHALANLSLLAAGHGHADPPAVVIEHGLSTVRLAGRRDGDEDTTSPDIEIHGTAGDYVSLQPLSGLVRSVDGFGLRYPLRGRSLSFGETVGLSNELSEATARIHVEGGRVLVIHTRRPEAS